jgi:hypothetical protein
MIFDIILLALGLKVVSRSPVEETLAIRLRVTPQTVTKVPQRRIFPSDCNSIVFTPAAVLMVALKVVSRSPVEETLAA